MPFSVADEVPTTVAAPVVALGADCAKTGADDNPIIDHGKIIDKEGRKVSMIESLAADDQGNVFMVGSWYSLSSDEASHQYIWQGLKDGFADMSDTYKKAKVRKHMLMNRGQFFSFVNVFDDIKR